MSKTRKHSRRSTMSMSKKMSRARAKLMMKNTADTAVQGIKKVGNVAKNVVSKSTPFVEKGITNIYGTMATGFDLGVKGAKTAAKSVSKMTKKQRSNRKSHRI